MSLKSDGSDGSDVFSLNCKLNSVALLDAIDFFHEILGFGEPSAEQSMDTLLDRTT